MPCSACTAIKAFDFNSASRQDPSVARRHGLSFTAGVSSFGILGGLIVALRAAGATIGWAFNQSPIVVAATYILFTVGLNLPESSRNHQHRWTLGRSQWVCGFRSSRVLATLVASPCSAIHGAAQSRGRNSTCRFDFQAVGLSMALPYLVLSFFAASAYSAAWTASSNKCGILTGPAYGSYGF